MTNNIDKNGNRNRNSYRWGLVEPVTLGPITGDLVTDQKGIQGGMNFEIKKKKWSTFPDENL